jgi:methylated-DNA-protein-cysteine methyltransferase related protein
MSWATVYKIVKQIPRGRVTTYGAVAKAIKLRGGARAAGYAMAACPRGPGIPWHRVVGAGGKIRIAEPAASLQRRLLQSEGVEIEGLSLNIKQYGWAPKKRITRRKKPPRA